MTTAIQSKDGAILVGMKNFTPRWPHFVPRFPQAKRTLEMCHSRAAAAAHCDWSALADDFRTFDLMAI
jgi:hypothetical protein